MEFFPELSSVKCKQTLLTSDLMQQCYSTFHLIYPVNTTRTVVSTTRLQSIPQDAVSNDTIREAVPLNPQLTQIIIKDSLALNISNRSVTNPAS